MDLTPEMMQALLGNAAYDDQQKMLEAQIAHARQLSMVRGQHHTTGGGAALGGAGDVLNQITARHQEQDALTQQRAMQQAYIDALKQASPQPQQPAQAQAIPPMLQRPEGQ